MSNARGPSVNSKSRLSIWAGIIGSFVAATGVQILFYAAPTLLGFGSYDLLGPLALPIAVLFFLVPAALATLVSVRLLRWGDPHVGDSVTVPAKLAVVLMALLSAYVGCQVGLFVAFRTWAA